MKTPTDSKTKSGTAFLRIALYLNFVAGIWLCVYSVKKYPLVTSDSMSCPLAWPLAGMIMVILALKAISWIANSTGIGPIWITREMAQRMTVIPPVSWPEVFIFAIPGLLSLTIGLCFFVNGYYGGLRSQTHWTTITDLETTHLKGGDIYDMYLSDWRAAYPPFKLSISDKTYWSHKVGDHIRVYTRTGRLGSEMIEKFDGDLGSVNPK